MPACMQLASRAYEVGSCRAGSVGELLREREGAGVSVTGTDLFLVQCSNDKSKTRGSVRELSRVVFLRSPDVSSVFFIPSIDRLAN